MSVTLHTGDCLDVMRGLPDNSVDSIVTDPPYGLSFMGKGWDKGVPSVAIWAEALRVLKPGGHLLAFAGTRTQHRMATAIEDAGFEIRDMIAWVYGSGFPKSLNVSKAIDKAAGAEREVVGSDRNFGASKAKDGKQAYGDYAGAWNITTPATPAARQWNGWGTALKPALEPITVARKPLAKGNTVAANVLAHGTGALNIDGARVDRDAGDVSGWSQTGSRASENRSMSGGNYARNAKPDNSGRFPANLIHDGSDEVVGLFPGADEKSAARFFYCAKASKADRDDELPHRNHHPTVKPTDLMRYLCRLVTPSGGVVLDPFMGSGSTGRGAVLEGFAFTGIDLEPEYVEIARARVEAAKRKSEDDAKQGSLFS